MMSMVCVTTGAIGTMCVEYEVCDKLSLPFTVPGMAVPAPHWALQQKIAPLPPGEMAAFLTVAVGELASTAWAYESWLSPSLMTNQ